MRTLPFSVWGEASILRLEKITRYCTHYSRLTVRLLTLPRRISCAHHLGCSHRVRISVSYKWLTSPIGGCATWHTLLSVLSSSPFGVHICNKIAYNLLQNCIYAGNMQFNTSCFRRYYFVYLCRDKGGAALLPIFVPKNHLYYWWESDCLIYSIWGLKEKPAIHPFRTEFLNSFWCPSLRFLRSRIYNRYLLRIEK